MAAASQEGLCGFIGSETDVPDLFALRFSLALLHLLFREHLSLGAAMLRHLRIDPLLPAPLLPPAWPGTRLRGGYRRFERDFMRLLRPTRPAATSRS